jgi:ABC-type multidrug transport system fused ATPase/permease subunit
MPDLSSPQGWTLVGVWTAAIGLVGLLIRQIGPWKKQISDAEENIRKELHSQIQAMKDDIVRERLEHATEMRAFNLERDEMGDRLAKMEKQLARQQLRHNAERSLDRHRLNNINACFDALLLLLKANPDKSADAVKMIEDMRAKQLVAEAEEKAIIRAAEIAADDAEMDHDGN